MLPQLPAAVLWDMDGTLVDTEPLWAQAEKALIDHHGNGSHSDADSQNLIGSDLRTAGAAIREYGKLAMTVDQVIDHLIQEMLLATAHGVTWKPGVHDLISELKELGIPCALVTNSYRKLADAVVQHLPAETFGAIVAGDEVDQGKPHPEPYLTAARQLGVDPTDCVVIEDSLPGTTSGLAAGASVISVPDHVTVTPQPGLVVIDSLTSLKATHLLPLFTQ